MQSPSCYQEVKLENGHLVNQIKGHDQKDWMTACERLGLNVLTTQGKGSHVAVYKDKTCQPQDRSCCVVTLPTKIYPNFQRDLVKKVVFHGIESKKYTEDEVWVALGVKKK
jgi:ferredoxin-like protein FixX